MSKDFVKEATRAFALDLIREGKLTVDEAEAKFDIQLKENLSLKYGSYADDFIVHDKRGKPQLQNVELAEYIVNEIGFFSCKRYDYIYGGKKWNCYDDDNLTLALIDNLTKSRCSNFQLQDALKTLRVRATIIEAELLSMRRDSAGMVNFKNCVFNIRTGERLVHNRSFFLEHILDFDYDSLAVCPKFQSFVARGLQEDQQQIQTFYEFIGYILEGGKPWWQAALILKGDANSGKSSALDLIEMICGDDNCSRIGLDELDDKFTAHQFAGKICNIADEVPDDPIDAQKFKRIIAGNKISAQDKGKPIYKLEPTVRFVIAANDLLRFRKADNLESLVKRQLYLNWDAPLTKDNQNWKIVDELREELPGIFNVVFGAHQILKARGKFLTPDATIALLNEFEREQDSSIEFLDEAVVPTENSMDMISFTLIYEKYVTHCKIVHRGVLGKQKFYRKMRKWVTKKGSPLSAVMYGNREVMQCAQLFSEVKPKT